MAAFLRFAFFLLVVIVAIPGRADEKKWGLNCSVDYKSSYLFSIGLRATKDVEPVVQEVCTIWHSSGFYAGIWASQSAIESGKEYSFTDEIDYYVGWSGHPVKGVPIRLTLDAEYYDFSNPSLFDWKGDAVDTNVRLAYDKWPQFVPFAEVHYLWELDESSLPDGWYATAGVFASIPLHKKVEWRIRADITHRWGLGLEPGQFAGARTSLTWKMGEHVTLRIPEIRVIQPLQSENERFLIIGTGIDFNF